MRKKWIDGQFIFLYQSFTLLQQRDEQFLMVKLLFFLLVVVWSLANQMMLMMKVNGWLNDREMITTGKGQCVDGFFFTSLSLLLLMIRSSLIDSPSRFWLLPLFIDINIPIFFSSSCTLGKGNNLPVLIQIERVKNVMRKLIIESWEKKLKFQDELLWKWPTDCWPNFRSNQ